MNEQVPGSRWIRLSLGILGVLILAVLLWIYLSDQGGDPEAYPYSTLLADAAAGKVTAISQDGTQLTVTLTGEAEPRIAYVATESVNVYAEVCAAMGEEPGPGCPIQYEFVPVSETGQWLGLLISALLPVVLIGAFFFFMMRAARKKE